MRHGKAIPRRPQVPAAARRARLLCWMLPATVLAAAACSGGGAAPGEAGVFRLESVNVPAGAIWQLNRPIRMVFNRAVDPDSVSFATIRMRPVEAGIAPVTGSFELEAGSGGRVVLFRPTCPTNESLDNGGLHPGGKQYELEIPTREGGSASVLRDRSGRPLSRGASRSFRTPIGPFEPLFLDVSPAPASVTRVEWPAGLNFFTEPDGDVRIHFDQPVDGRAENLAPDRIHVQYAEGEIGSPGEHDFLHDVPGATWLQENCTEEGAVVVFSVHGLLPPNRRLRLLVESGFRDLGGQTHQGTLTWPDHETPTLAELYQDPSWSSSQETVEEFADHFVDSRSLDLDAALLAPPAEIVDGQVVASFDFPGQFVGPEEDLFLDDSLRDVFTDGVVVFTDSRNRSFVVQNGVLFVDDFTIAAGATLRGRGKNPLVVYATGSVTIDGTLDVSGDDATHPASLNSPQFPESGAAGQCGGGRGGTSSIVTDAATLRGEDGDGPFGLRHAGGQGGEGGFQQGNRLPLAHLEYILSAGGGGGTFALTPNVAIVWDRWGLDQRPHAVDDTGPDHIASIHPMFDPASVIGGEAGLRGNSWMTSLLLSQSNPQDPHGMYGMEDEGVDDDVEDTSWDPPWTSGAVPPFGFGHPTKGPDPGRPGPSTFRDGDPRNDFWGARPTSDGGVIRGELLTPWAGSGGGASGDSQLLARQDLDGIPGLDPLPNFFPLEPFSSATQGVNVYRKGAPGGGGGGQLQIMAIGEIRLGPACILEANGGTGNGGESTGSTKGQVSGSGGGSGGHIILHSATGLDLSGIDIGGPGPGQMFEAEVVQAVGGRRGWCASSFSSIPGSLLNDGNGTFMVGRGGAGGNGVVQIHVPDPGRTIQWPPAAASYIRDYIHHGDPLNGAVDYDRLDEILDLFAAPAPVTLLPVFASESQVQSRWIDVGLAGLRAPGGATTGDYPDFASALLRFAGLDGEGRVLTSQGKVESLAAIASGPTTAVAFDVHEAAVASASSYFAAHLLRHPGVLEGYDLLPSDAGGESFQITEAVYRRGDDTLQLVTLPADGALPFAVQPGQPWSVRPRFFRVSTGGARHSLPNSAGLRLEFQGQAEPDAQVVPGPAEWTSDLADLQGLRRIRYRATFDIDAQGAGVTPVSPRPALDYVKIPFVW